MKRLVLISLLCFLGGIISAQTNKIQNSGFESEFNIPKKENYTFVNGKECDKWILTSIENHGTYPSLGSVNLVNTEKNSGENSMEIKLEKIGARYTFFLLHYIKGLNPGKYTLSFYSKANVADMPFRVDAVACGGVDYKTEKILLGAKDDIQGIYPDNQAGHMLKTSTEWQKHTIEFFASSLTKEDLGVLRLMIRPNCVKSGSSGITNTPVTYWFDDFELINEKPVESGYPTFAAISDIHVNRGGNWEGKINKTLSVLTNQIPKLDAIFIAGDITHEGTQEEYDLLKKIMDEKVPADIPVYYCMGNHDWWAGAAEAGNMFVNTLGQPLNQYIKVKGYPFIMISMETKNEKDAYGTKTRSFLSNALITATAEFPGKPIFVFMHIPNANTVYGSFEIGGADAWGTDNVQDILNNYPQVMAISGHSHYFLSDERSIHQDKFTSINDGSAAYAETEKGLEGGTRPKDGEKVLEGCFISIDEDNDVTVKRWDIFNDKEIKQAWKIEAPHDGTKFAYKNRDGMPAPYFETNDKVNVTKTSTSSCTIDFPIAKDEDAVQHYKIEVLNTGQQFSNVVASYKILSQYYLPNEAATISWNITSLTEGVEYTIQAVAVDAFGNESEALGSEKFILDNSTGIFSQVNDKNLLNVYPNPVLAGSAINIAAELSDDSLKNVNVDIYNLTGALVQNAQLTGNNTSVNMPIVSGTYIVKVKIDGLDKEFKVLVK